MHVSIIICTRNRAGDLRRTLEAMARVVTSEMPCELLVVDNGSTDETPQAVRAGRLPNMAVRYLSEPRRGQCHARNTGLAQAQGRVVLFTDDDVLPPQDWVAGMAGPILSGVADAVAGGVTLAPHLLRPWMTPLHRALLASTEGLDAQAPERMVGANMAFAKAVLGRVPGFDTELGPGALGFEDEVLFSSQLREAGFRLTGALGIAVEHHFDPTRLSRASFLRRVTDQGRSTAYVAHHWAHGGWNGLATDSPLAGLLKSRLRLMRWRSRHRPLCQEAEGLSEAEIYLATSAAFYRQYLQERRRPRLYEVRGLVKRIANS